MAEKKSYPGVSREYQDYVKQQWAELERRIAELEKQRAPRKPGRPTKVKANG